MDYWRQYFSGHFQPKIRIPDIICLLEALIRILFHLVNFKHYVVIGRFSKASDKFLKILFHNISPPQHPICKMYLSIPHNYPWIMGYAQECWWYDDVELRYCKKKIKNYILNDPPFVNWLIDNLETHLMNRIWRNRWKREKVYDMKKGRQIQWILS